MSRTEVALQRISAAVGRLEQIAERPAVGLAGEAEALQTEVDRLKQENQELGQRAQAEADKNKDLGARLDAVIAKLNRVLEQD